ncbi:autotransporter [Rodentibacter sp. JRC1]|uniref:ESPR-type extended signal peptide-containing protein n=1 Tax=Rodentibacter TaxID=1960084 RepID=UPI001CFD8177|nr:YadA-like family protein [Rodentibacter sp. JRC1]GJI56338.1 autotransporter [Rodentibacter sp. JRC1]
MNKIFKVIWNHSLGTWVAVSELAKGYAKSSSSSSVTSKEEGNLERERGGLKLSKITFLLLALTAVGTSWAVNVGSTKDVGNYGTISIGESGEFGSSEYSRVGRGTGEWTSSTLHSIAIGGGASTDYARATALGYRASVTRNDSVAIGSNSTTGSTNLTNADKLPGTNYIFAGAPNSSTPVFSVGNARSKLYRQIQNVAAGSITENSTDAINGSQLYAVVRAIGELNTTSAGLSNFIVGADKNHNATGINVTKDANRFDVISADEKYLTTKVNGTSVEIDLNASSKQAINQVANNTQNISKNTQNIANNTQNISNNNKNITNNTKNITNNTNTIAKGFGLKASDGQNVTHNLGSPIEVIGGNSNVNTTVNGGKVQINLNNTLDLSKTGSVKTGDTTLNNTGLTISGGPSVTKNGINAGNQKITNVSNGTSPNDAVNFSQLNATNNNVTNLNNTVNNVNATVNKGWNINTTKSGTGNVSGSSNHNIKMGDTVTIDAGDNINITQASGKISIATSKTPNFTSVDTGNLTVRPNGNINFGGNKLTNVSNGTSSTDAVNLQQLNASKTEVKAGNNVNVTKTSDANGSVYTVNADKSIVSNGSDKVKVTATAGANNTTNYSVDLSDTAKTQLAKEESVNSTSSNVIVTENGKNSTGGKNYSVSLNNTLNLTDAGSVKAGSTLLNNTGLTISGGPSVTQGGINAGSKKITNVSNGTDPNDAVNFSQLNATNNNVTNLNNTVNNVNATVNKGWNINTTASAGGNVSGNKDHNVKMGDTVTIDAGKNINITQSNGKISIATSDTPNFTAVSTQNLTVRPNGNIDFGNNVLHNVAAPTADTDAANKKYVDDGRTTVNSTDKSVNVTASGANPKNYDLSVNMSKVANDVTLKYSADSGNGTNKLAEEVKFKGSDYVKTTAKNGEVAFDLSDNAKNKINNAMQNFTVGADKANAVAGLNITNGGRFDIVGAENNYIDTAVSGNNITVGLNAKAVDSIEKAQKGFGLKAQDGANVTHQLGEAIEVIGGNSNLNTTIADGKVKINLNNTLDLTKDGSVTIGNTSLNNDGLTITGGPSVTKDGINAGDKPITNVSNGTNATDAVNVQQLNASTAAAKTEVKQGNNVVITNTTAADGHTVYTVNANTSSVSNGSDSVVVTGTHNATTGITDYSVDLSQKIKEQIAKEESVSAGSDLVSVAENATKNSTGGKDFIVNINAQKVVENAQLPVVYTNANGDKLVKVGDKFYKAGDVTDGKPNSGVTPVSNGDVIASLNSGNNSTNTPMSLGNLKGNLDNVTNKNTGNPATANKYDNVKNNAATVGDVLNAGWNLQNNGQAVDFVTHGNTVNFNNGTGVTVNTVYDENTGTTNLTFNTTNSYVDTNGAQTNAPTNTVKFIGNNTSAPVLITNVASGVDTPNTNGTTWADKLANVSGDALNNVVNVGDLKNAVNSGVSSVGFNLTSKAVSGTNGDSKIADNLSADDKRLTNNDTFTLDAGNNIAIKQIKDGYEIATADNVTFTNVTIGKDGENGVDGKLGVNGKDGASIVLNGKDGSIGLTGPKGADGANGKSANISVAEGQTTVSEKDKGQNITRIVYNTTDKDGNTVTREVATMDDGLKFKGDNDQIINRTLGSQLNITGGASNVSTLTDNNIGVVGNASGDLVLKLNRDLNLTKDGSLVIGNSTLTDGGLVINGGPSVTKDGINAGDKKITNVADGNVSNGSKEAINGGQLYNAISNSGFDLATNGEATGVTDKRINNNETFNLNQGKNIVVKQIENGYEISTGNNLIIGEKGEPGQNGQPGKDGVDGSIGVNGKDGSAVVINGKDGSIGLNGKDGTNGLTIKGGQGPAGVNGKDGETTTRIEYVDSNNVTHKVATLDDGLKFKGDKGEVINKKLNETLNITGGANGTLTENNIGIVSKDGNLTVKLAENINLGNNGSVTIGNVTMGKDGFNAGNTTITNVKGNLDNVTNDTKSNPDVTGNNYQNITKNAATVGDVLNAGWNLQNNGQAVDFVTHGNTVNFNNGTGVSVKTDYNNTTGTTNITFNTTNSYVDSNGNLTNEPTNKVKFVGGNISAPVLITNVDSGVLPNGATIPANQTFNDVLGNLTGDALNNVVNVGDLKNATKDIANTTLGAIGFGLKSTKVDGTNGVAEEASGLTDEDKRLTNNETFNLNAGNNIVVKQIANGYEIATSNNVTIGKNGKDGVDGTIGVNGKDGASVVLNGKDGSIGLTGPKGADGKDGASANITVANGTGTLDENSKGGDGIERIVYNTTNKDGSVTTREIATKDDGLVFQGDNGKAIKKKLGETLNITGGVTEESKLTDNNIGIINKDGNLTVKLSKDLNLTDKGTITIGDVNLSNGGLTINGGPSINKDGINAGDKKITNVADGNVSNGSKEAINGGQLYTAITNSGFNLTTKAVADSNGQVSADGLSDDDKRIATNETFTLDAGNNLVIKQIANGYEIATGNNITVGAAGKDGKPGVDGTIGVNGKDGASVVINGKDGSIGLTGPKGQDGKDGASATLQVVNGTKGLDGNDGKDGESKTRIEYVKPDGTKEEVATLKDGLVFKGDNDTKINRTLNSQLEIVGGAKEADLTDNNIGVIGDANGTMTIKLNKDLNLTDKGSVNLGGTVLNSTGLTITNGPSITKDGINAGDKKVTNVTEGTLAEDSKDAVNGSQLYATNQNITNVTNDVAKGWNITTSGNANGTSLHNVRMGDTVTLDAGNNINITQTNGTISISTSDTPNFANVTVGKDGQNGIDGTIGVNGKDGASVVLNGKDGSIGLTGPKGADGKSASANITVANGTGTLDENGKGGDGIERIVYNTTNKDGSVTTREIATKDDGLVFKGDNGKAIKKKLGETLNITGGVTEADKLTDNNIGVVNKDGNLTVKLSKDLNLTDKGSVTIGNVSISSGGIDLGNTTITNLNGNLDKVDNTTTSNPDQTGNKYENITNNAATVGDVLNAGWNLQANGNAVDFVTHGNTVNFNNGTGVAVNAVYNATTGATNITFNTTNSYIDENGALTNTPSNKVKFIGANNSAPVLITNVDSGVLPQGTSLPTNVTFNEYLNNLTGDALNNVVNAGDLKNATQNITKDTLSAVGFNLKSAIVAGSNGAVSEQDGLTEADKRLTNNETFNLNAGNNIVIKQIANGYEVATSNNITVGAAGKDGKDGVDGTIGVNGKDGSAVVINGKDGSIGLTGAKGADGKDGASATIKVVNGTKGLDGNDGKDGESKTRIEYVKPNGDKEEIATLKDGLQFKGDNDQVINRTLNSQLNIVGGAQEANLTANNIGVIGHANGTMEVKLNKDLNLTKDGSITLGNTTLKDGNFTMGNVTINNDGLTIKDGPSITNKGIDAGNKAITNVANGTNATDAVNLSQLNASTAAAKTEVQQGKNVVVTNTTAADGHTIYTVNAEKSVVTGSNAVNVTTTVDKANFTTSYNIDLSDEMKKQIAKEESVTAGDSNIKVVANGTNRSGGKNFDVSLNKDLNLTKDGSVTIGGTSLTDGNVTVGNTTLNNDGLAIKNGPSITNEGINAGNKKVTNVADGDISPNSKDAINGSQLYTSIANSGFNLATNGEVIGTNKRINNNETFTLNQGKNIVVKQIDNGYEVSTANNFIIGEKGEPGKDGVDGTIGVNGKDGSSVVINGKDGSIGLTGPKGADGKNATATIRVIDGQKGLDGNDGKDGESKTRIEYTKQDGSKEQVATLNDGLEFMGDSGTVSKQKLNSRVNVVGGQADESKLSSAANIGVVSDGKGKLTVKLAKDIDLGKEGSVAIGNTTVNNNGLVIKGSDPKGTDTVSVTDKGISAGNKVISNVAPGVKPTDAVNKGQLDQVRGDIYNVNNRVDNLDKRVRGIGANAAAASSLPQVYMPGKSMVAAAAGGYSGASAIAVGYSRASDNGKVILKLTGTANSAGHYSGGVGVGYQW